MGMRTKYQDHSTPGVNLGLIITPMLDMSFQILSFFIMTYHPSALEGHIAGSLAPPTKVATTGQENKLEDVLSVPEELLLPDVQDPIRGTVKVGVEPCQPGKRL